MRGPFIAIVRVSVSLSLAVGPLSAEELTDLHATPRMRGPVAAVLCNEGRLLCVANHRSGTISLIDLETRSVTAEFKLGEALSDVALSADGQSLLITDEARHELLIVRPTATGVEVVERIATPRYPVSVTVSDVCRYVAVACLWSHRVAC